MSEVQRRSLSLASGLSAELLEAGKGTPVVWLHDHLGHQWNDFLESLSQSRQVFALRHPGSDDPDVLSSFDGFADLAMYYDDVLNSLGLDSVSLVGHGFGAMAAAEFASRHSHRVDRLVLMSPLGLWRDDEPIPDISSVPKRESMTMLSLDRDVLAKVIARPDDPDLAADAALGRVYAQASVSHFIWPIPDRGLRKRLYRIVCPTLVVCGAEDLYIPPSYGADFVDHLPNATLATIEGAGYLAHLEVSDHVTELVQAHLD